MIIHFDLHNYTFKHIWINGYTSLYSHILVLVCVMFSPFVMKWHRKL